MIEVTLKVDAARLLVLHWLRSTYRSKRQGLGTGAGHYVAVLTLYYVEYTENCL